MVMKTRISICIAALALVLMLSSFSHADNDIPDEELLALVLNCERMELYNHGWKVAPQLCMQLASIPKHYTAISTSIDTATHGTKIYRLYVKDAHKYQFFEKEQPAGQVFVKSTWSCTEVNSKEHVRRDLALNDSVFLHQTLRDKFFVMYKPVAPSYTTDSGWVYGVVSADKKTVLQKGLIPSCISCHKVSSRDRILGYK